MPATAIHAGSGVLSRRRRSLWVSAAWRNGVASAAIMSPVTASARLDVAMKSSAAVSPPRHMIRNRMFAHSHGLDHDSSGMPFTANECSRRRTRRVRLAVLDEYRPWLGTSVNAHSRVERVGVRPLEHASAEYGVLDAFRAGQMPSVADGAMVGAVFRVFGVRPAFDDREGELGFLLVGVADFASGESAFARRFVERVLHG